MARLHYLEYHNHAVIHLHLVAATDSWCEEDYLNEDYGNKQYI